MFASRITKEVPITEGTITITTTIRKLSRKSLENASEIRQQAAIAAMKNARADVIEAMKSKVAETATAKPAKKFAEFNSDERKAAFYATYDSATVLRAGIQSWASNDTAFNPPPIETGVDDLDEGAADTLFIAIMDLSIPPTDVAKEAASKG